MYRIEDMLYMLYMPNMLNICRPIEKGYIKCEKFKYKINPNLKKKV